jgi:hypothetical protein
MKTFAIALAALALATPAHAAAQMTAGDLYRLCTSADKGEQTACRFFVFGVAEGFGRTPAPWRRTASSSKSRNPFSAFPAPG